MQIRSCFHIAQFILLCGLKKPDTWVSILDDLNALLFIFVDYSLYHLLMRMGLPYLYCNDIFMCFDHLDNVMVGEEFLPTFQFLYTWNVALIMHLYNLLVSHAVRSVKQLRVFSSSQLLSVLVLHNVLKKIIFSHCTRILL